MLGGRGGIRPACESLEAVRYSTVEGGSFFGAPGVDGLVGIFLLAGVARI